MRKNSFFHLVLLQTIVFLSFVPQSLKAITDSIPEILRTRVELGSSATGIGNKDARLLYFTLTANSQLQSARLAGINLSLSGTSDVADITKLKVYQTANNFGLESEWAAPELLAEVAVGKDFQLDKVQYVAFQHSVELTGRTHFWVTADISSKATEGHVVEARLHSYSCWVKGQRIELNEKKGNPDFATKIFLTESILASTWKDHSKYWRIPAIATGRNGRLIAVMDKRWDSQGDLPNNIDVAVTYSDDQGKTWSPIKVIVGTPEKGGDYGHGDPSIVYDKKTGDLIVVVVGKNGFLQSTPDHPILNKVLRSHDNGETWSEPKDITPQIYGSSCNDPVRKKWNGAFATSGAMSQDSKGRIFSVLCVREEANNHITNYMMYSDDLGENWKVCMSRVADGGDESKVLEMADGNLRASIRHRGGRLFNIGKKGGTDYVFGEQVLEARLMEPACNGDFLRYTLQANGANKNRLLHTIPNFETDRRNISVFLSYDEGKTWPVSKVICPGRGAYSALTILQDGTIGCFYEDDGVGYLTDGNGYTMRFVRFSLDWLTDGQDSEPSFKK